MQRASPRPAVMSRVPAWAVLPALAGLAVGGWLPFLVGPLSPDEAGLLMIGGQLGDGSSLYGDYWVDRPPLLLALFGLASLAGDAAGVRVLGLLAVVSTVLAAGLLGRLVAPHLHWAAVATAGVAAVAASSRMLGAGLVNGEALAVPLVLLGLCAVVAALRQRRDRGVFLLACAAGLLGAAAVLVKQNFIDVFVFLGAVVVLELRRGAAGRPRAARLASGAGVGAAITVAVVIGGAAMAGSPLGDLWYAVVSFRGEATAVIAESATDDTTFRLVRMLAAIVGSGLALLVAALVPGLSQPATLPEPLPAMGDSPNGSLGVPLDLRAPALAVLGWELFVVLLGGSYWLHYLLGLIPGMTLLVAAALQRPLRGRRALRAAVMFSVVSAACSVGYSVLNPVDRPEDEPITYLAEHASPGETGVVAFGRPNILLSVGLRSPYPDLWSLPVRVRDPRLERFAALLAGPDRPEWLIVVGGSLATWGVDSTAADPFVDRFYDLQAVTGGYRIYRVADGS